MTAGNEHATNLQQKWISMQKQKLSTGEVDHIAHDWIRHVAGIDPQNRWHDERKPSAHNVLMWYSIFESNFLLFYFLYFLLKFICRVLRLRDRHHNS